MTSWDEPEATGHFDVSLVKRGAAGARSERRLVPPPEPEPLAEWEPEPGGGREPQEAPAATPDLGAVPSEVSLRIPLWWLDGGRGDAAGPGQVPPVSIDGVSIDTEPADRASAEGTPYDQRAGFEPLGSAPPFAWSFDEEEPASRSSGGRRVLWVVGGATAAAVVVVVALVLGGGQKSDKRAASQPSAAPPAASASPPGPASAYVPRALALGGVDGRVQVTWQPPERVGEVVGFMVVAQSREGAVLEHRLVPAGETSAAFASPPMTRDGCIVVATLVRGGTGVTPVRADPVCR